MSVAQRSATEVRAVACRQTGGRGRKLRGLAELLRAVPLAGAGDVPSLVLATAAALAPAPLAKLAIDQGIQHHDVGALDLIVVAFLVSAVVYAVATYAQTYLVGWVGPARAAGPARPAVPHLQSLSIGFYSRNRAGVIISPADQRRRGARPARRGRAGHADPVRPDADRRGRDPARAGLPPGAADVHRAADAGRRARSRSGSPRPTPTGSPARRSPPITGYLQETLSGIRVVRAFGQERRHIERVHGAQRREPAANMTTVKLNAAYFPARRAAVGAGHGRDPRRSAGSRRSTATPRPASCSRSSPRSTTSSIRSSSSRSCTRPTSPGWRRSTRSSTCSTSSPSSSTRPTRDELGQIRGELRFDDVSFRYGADDDGAWALRDIDLTIPPGQTVALVGETGAGKSTFAKLVARFYDQYRIILLGVCRLQFCCADHCIGRAALLVAIPLALSRKIKA